MAIRSIILTSLISLFAIGASAQRCFETVEKKCEPDKKSGYIVSGQSKNGTFAPADTAIVTLTFYPNMDYRISFCSTDPNIEGKVEFQVIEYASVAEYEEVITYEEVYPEVEEEEYSEEEESYDEYGDYDEYEEEEEYVEPEPIKVPVITKKRVYKKVPQVIFDNTANSEGGDLAQEFYHIARERKTVYIKVFIPSNQGGTTEESNANKAKGKTVSYACVGLLVEHQSAPRLGFK